MIQRNKNSGFSLVELLVVIAIIAILAAVITVNVYGGRGKARDAQRITDMKAVQTALALYYDSCGGFPAEDPAIDISGLGLDDSCAGWISGPTTEPIYMLSAPAAQMPAEDNCPDVNPPNSNTYWYTSDGDTYTINFCIGTDVSDLAAGPHTVSQDGLQ